MTQNANDQFEQEMQAAYEARQKKKAEEAEKQNYSSEHRLPIPVGKYTLVRALDVPQPIYYSFIKCDDDKTRLFKFPSPDNNPEFIIYKVAKNVLNRIYLGKNDKNEAQWEYPMEKTNPDIFRLVLNNGNVARGKYGWNGWTKESGKADCAYYMNVINRLPFRVTRKDKDGNEESLDYDANWCYDNNHSLLLCKSMTAIGVPTTVSDMLLDRMMGNFGPFNNYDIAVMRLNNRPWYVMEKAETLAGAETEAIKQAAVIGPLTDKDKDLERYDVRELAKPTPLLTIYQNLQGHLGKIDTALGTTYLQDLKASIDQESGPMMTGVGDTTEPETPAPAEATPAPEAAPAVTPGPAETPSVGAEEAQVGGFTYEQWKNSGWTDEQLLADPEKAVLVPKPAEPVAPPAPPEPPAPPAPPAPASAPAAPAAPAGDVDAALLEVAPHVNKLTPEQKALIKGVKVVDGAKVIEFTTGDLGPCVSCGVDQPMDIDKFCIFCGTTFK